MTTPSSPEYYTDDAGEVRWRVTDTNGEITEASTEGFANLRKAFDNFTLTRSNVQITYEQAQEQIHDQDPGDDSGSGEGSGGQLADSSGSAGEGNFYQETDGRGGAGGAE